MKKISTFVDEVFFDDFISSICLEIQFENLNCHEKHQVSMKTFKTSLVVIFDSLLCRSKDLIPCK